MFLKVQGQLTCVDQEAYLQLRYTTGHRPEPKRAELGEQVTGSFCVPEEVFNWMALESQPTKSVPRRVVLAVERHIVAMSPDRTLQPRTRSENLYVRSVERTRPLRGIAPFDEKCDLTDADAQEATVRACRSAKLGIIHRLHPGQSRRATLDSA